MINEENEKYIEKKIDFIAKTTLGALKGIFLDNGLTDREATLTLIYFIEVFIEIGWKDNNPTDVLENIIEVMKAKHRKS